VLEESARIALSWVRAHAPALGLPGDASCPSRKWDVHIHLPAGAVPKDGPSAGITLAVALVSLFTERCVRPDVAMTGGGCCCRHTVSSRRKQFELQTWQT
jgi:ATP-dependent Lon protease